MNRRSFSTIAMTVAQVGPNRLMQINGRRRPKLPTVGNCPARPQRAPLVRSFPVLPV
jgi:hypothetical protein